MCNDGEQVCSLTRGSSCRTTQSRGTAPRVRSGPVQSAEMEISDDVGVQDVGSRDPTALLWVVPLPVHQVLEPTPTTSGVQEGPDGKGEAPIDVQGRRGGRPPGPNSAPLDRTLPVHQVLEPTPYDVGSPAGT